jgi:hypothetical protein
VERDTFIRVRPELITGRRIGNAAEAIVTP